MTLPDDVDAIDAYWMEQALVEARKCLELDEVPVGAVMVFENRIIARSGNRTITDCDPTAHAEILAVRAGATAVRNHRLPGTTLYVTLEPCAMCAGALIQARVTRLVYGASDPRVGAVASRFEICSTTFLNHRVSVTGGVLVEPCGQILRDFFRERRSNGLRSDL